MDYNRIIQLLRSKGATTISDHIIKTTEMQIRMESREERLKFHRNLEEWITSCDCMVAEVSFPSISVGYEVSLALNRFKPVLLLYKNGEPPSLLAEYHDERLICEHYTSQDLPGIIDDFLNYVKGAVDSRFTFYITAQIAFYLEKISQSQKIPKSVYLRRLIEREMAKNR